jgi:asparagine synthase (glutamine-hydrolysing)
VFAEDARRELLGPAVDSLPSPHEECRAVFAETAGAESLSRLLAVDLTVLMPSDQLTKTDRASMAHSLEARVPFLDQTVVDFALELPASLKVRGMAKKRLLRRAVAPLLPEQIIRGRKRGFSIPAAAWFRGELQPFLREALSESRLRNQGYFEPRAVGTLIDRHVSGREDLSRQLWGLMMFSLWHDAYATAPTAAVPR